MVGNAHHRSSRVYSRSDTRKTERNIFSLLQTLLSSVKCKETESERGRRGRNRLVRVCPSDGSFLSIFHSVRSLALTHTCVSSVWQHWAGLKEEEIEEKEGKRWMTVPANNIQSLLLYPLFLMWITPSSMTVRRSSHLQTRLGQLFWFSYHYSVVWDYFFDQQQLGIISKKISSKLCCKKWTAYMSIN